MASFRRSAAAPSRRSRGNDRQRLHSTPQLVEMRDDAIRIKFRDVPVGVAEIDRDHRHARTLRGEDVRLRIADHDRALWIAAGALDGRDQRPRIGLAEWKRILAADRTEA